MQPRAAVEQWGWGHVQSFSFEGNLVFLTAYSPLLEGKDFKPKEEVSFEVVEAADGVHLAVALAVPGQDVAPNLQDGEKPWEDAAAHEVEVFISSNRKWFGDDGATLFRGFPTDDQQRIMAAGSFEKVRDPCKVMYVRIQKAKEATGEIEPYDVRRARKGPRWTDEEWAAWKEGRFDGDSSSSAAGEKRPSGDGRDDTWGNEDGCGIFFGGLTSEVNEAGLRAFAESVGTVRMAKLFAKPGSDAAMACGKVIYERPEMAQRALKELHKVELYGKRVSAEILGDETRRGKRRKPDENAPMDFEDQPRIIPESYFDDVQTVHQKIELCFGVFEDLLVNHDPVSTGKGVVMMVRNLFREINDLFEGDNDAKQAAIQRFKCHQWFSDNLQQVKWQANKNRINLSKVSPSTLAGTRRHMDFQQEPGFVQKAQQWSSSMHGVWDAAAVPQQQQQPTQSLQSRPLPTAVHRALAPPTRPLLATAGAAAGRSGGGAWRY